MKNITDSDGEAEFARLEAMQRRVHAEIDRFSGADRLNRDEVYDEDLNDGQDYAGVRVENPFR